MVPDSLPVSDHVSIQCLLAQYAMLMDKGDASWADLFVQDDMSELAGITPEPIRGVERLRTLPIAAFERNAGRVYHHIHNIQIQRGQDDDSAAVQAYGLVTDWRQGGKLVMLAKYTMALARTPEGWRIRKVSISVVR
jgi:hypothetical protein